MAEANATAEAEQQTQTTTTPDPKDLRIQELEAKNASLETNGKAMQRNLERTRTQLAQTQQLTGDVQGLKADFGMLMEAVAANPELDTAVKTKLADHGTRQTRQQQVAAYQKQQSDAIADIVAEAGVEDWGEERMAEVVACMTDGDYAGARREARSVVRAEKAKQTEATKTSPADGKVSKFTPTQQAEIDAEVERKVRASGVRAVDDGKTKGAGAAHGGAFTKTNMKDRLASMSREDILKSLGDINQAS